MPADPRSTPKLEAILGGVLREMRLERGLSQEELGHAIGSGRTYLSELERGEKNPTVKMLFRLAAGLGTTPTLIIERVQQRVQQRASPHEGKR
ncbi:MAG: helix-turn-helix transcriptional regulator [Actinomycetota bacterium]